MHLSDAIDYSYSELRAVAPTLPEDGFVNGERWVSSHAPITAVPQGKYYYSRLFQLAGGTYVLKYGVDDAATLWVGRALDALTMVAALSLNDGLAEKEIYLPSGLNRIDMLVQNIPDYASPAGFIFSLWRDGKLVYGSSKTGWKLDTVPIPDELLPLPSDPHRLLPVFTITPNWKDGIIERLSWLTDVLDSESGAEQRRALRLDPRRTFEAGFLRKGPNRAMLDAFLTGIGQDEFLLPLWHEALKMTKGIDESANGVDFVSGMGSEREWVKGGLALAINGDPNHYDILVVGSVNENGLIWETPPLRSWPPGTMIFPLRTARITENTPMENVTENVGTVQIRFTLSESMRVAEDWLANINGIPLFPFIPNRSQPVKAEYTRDVGVLDNQVGNVRYTDIAEHTAVTYSFPITLQGRRNVMRLRQFLQAARGRARSFLMPTFTDDLEPLLGEIAPTNVLMVKPMGIGRYHRGAQSARRAIAVTLSGQDLPGVFRNVIGVEKQYVDQFGLDVNYETANYYDRIMLDAPMPHMLSSQIGRISFIAESRFAMDSFELHHPTNTSAVVKTSVVVRQLRNRRMRDNRYPPSPPFPPAALPPEGAVISAGRTVWDVNPKADVCEAVYTLGGDGIVETRELSTGAVDRGEVWSSIPTETSRYEVRADRVDGDALLRFGVIGEWQHLGTSRGWALRSETNVSPRERRVTLALTFRELSTGTVRGSYNVTLVARSK